MLFRSGVQSQIGKRARHRFGEVTQGVNQGAVQIEDDGVPWLVATSESAVIDRLLRWFRERASAHSLRVLMSVVEFCDVQRCNLGVRLTHSIC